MLQTDYYVVWGSRGYDHRVPIRFTSYVDAWEYGARNFDEFDVEAETSNVTLAQYAMSLFTPRNVAASTVLLVFLIGMFLAMGYVEAL